MEHPLPLILSEGTVRCISLCLGGGGTAPLAPWLRPCLCQYKIGGATRSRVPHHLHFCVYSRWSSTATEHNLRITVILQIDPLVMARFLRGPPSLMAREGIGLELAFVDYRISVMVSNW